MTAPERSFRLKPPGPGPAALLGFIALALTFATCVVPWADGDPVLQGPGW